MPLQLIRWSQKEFKHLPWRNQRSLYSTLVSEIMLQQTTVGTVMNHYERFLKIFPDLMSLAAASDEEMTIAWKGLGYYRRARNLKKIAEHIQRDYKGEFPTQTEQLEKIPGIGPYTSNALLAIGMDRRALAVDANLERVLSRLFGIKEEKGLKLQKAIHLLFAEGKIFPQKNISFRALNEALMDLGRTYCQARKASCDLCPMKAGCQAFLSGKPLTFPIEKLVVTAKKQEHELQLLRVYVIKGDKLLVYRKTESEWLAGQFEVPTFILKTTDLKLEQYPKFSGRQRFDGLNSFKTGITKYKIENRIFIIDEKQFKSLGFKKRVEWKKLGDVNANLSTATTKGLLKVLGTGNNSKDLACSGGRPLHLPKRYSNY